MTFSSENEYIQWLKINGYERDIIDTISFNWKNVSIINGEIVDNTNSVNKNISNEISDTEN